MAKEQKDFQPKSRSGVSTGLFLPSPIVHSSTRLSRLGDPATNAKQVGHVVQRLLGFWFVYNAVGGLDAMIASGLWPKSTAYKQLAEFRAFYGCDPEDLEPELGSAIVRAAATWPAKYSKGLKPVLDRQRRDRTSSTD
jgi:hypothetical protein